MGYLNEKNPLLETRADFLLLYLKTYAFFAFFTIALKASG